VRNGFLYDQESGSYQKDQEDKSCDVFPPSVLADFMVDSKPYWTVNFDFELRSHVNITGSDARDLIIKYGFAEP